MREIMEHLQLFIELNGAVMGLFGVGVSTALTLIYRKIKKMREDSKKRDQRVNENAKKQEEILAMLNQLTVQVADLAAQSGLQKKTSLAVTHHEIYTYFEKLIERTPQQLTIDELNDIEHLWDAYSCLGGNGTGERMYQQIMNFQIVTKEGTKQ